MQITKVEILPQICLMYQLNYEGVGSLTLIWHNVHGGRDKNFSSCLMEDDIIGWLVVTIIHHCTHQRRYGNITCLNQRAARDVVVPPPS